jgi:carbamoyl-phosphate synthase small subunit
MKGLISTDGLPAEEAVARARQWLGLVGVDYVKEVTHKQDFLWDPKDEQSSNFRLISGTDVSNPRHVCDPLPAADIPVVAYDFGIKYNILRRLRQHGFRVRVVPATASAQEALASKPAGIFLSNGPGDPAALPYAAKAIAELISTGIPIFGICLGHQILGLALGGRTFKLKFGHRGGNQPVKDLTSGKVEITSQNHGFAVDPASLPPEIEVDRINLNDQTVEGMCHRQKPVFCVQYHPEASPGPHDSTSLFRRFRELVSKR